MENYDAAEEDNVTDDSLDDEVDNLPAGGPGQGGERPSCDYMVWQVRNIPNLSSRGLPINPKFLSKR